MITTGTSLKVNCESIPPYPSQLNQNFTMATSRRVVLLLLYVPVLVYLFLQLESFRRTLSSTLADAPLVGDEVKQAEVQHENMKKLDALLNDTVLDLSDEDPSGGSRSSGTRGGGHQHDYRNTTNTTLRMIRGQLENENAVEPPLPPMGQLPKAHLNTSSSRIFNDAATMGIQMTIGVLTAPGLLRTRLIPLLETSLRDERDVHVFFADTNWTLAGRLALREYLESVGRTKDVHIVPLKPLGNMVMSIRNAWVDLPALVHMHAVRPTQRWFAIMDDDTYFLTNAIRRILRDAELRQDLDGQPVYMGAPITDGLMGGCRVLRNGKNLRLQRTTTRKEVQFVCGGSGILINNLAVERLLVFNATVGKRMVDFCMKNMLQPAGDVRLGHCLSEAKVPIVARREMFRDNVFLAIGEKAQYNKYEFPASFHRFRKREWQYAVRALTDLREANELVTWGDLILNFRPGPEYWHSFFYPKQYVNFTEIYGIRVRTPKELIRDKLIWKRFKVDCAPKQNTDLW